MTHSTLDTVGTEAEKTVIRVRAGVGYLVYIIVPVQPVE